MIANQVTYRGCSMPYLIITSLIWAFSYGLIKTKLNTLDPNFVASIRMGCALLVFTPFLRIKTINIKQIIQLISIGAIQYGLMYLCFLRSFKYLDAYLIALFTTFTPIYVILINDIYAKKFHPRYLLLALLATFGGAVIYYENILQSNLLLGFLLVQGADLCFAFGQVAYKRFRLASPGIQDKSIYALLFLGALIVGIMATSYNSGWHSFSAVSGQQAFVLAYLGCIASGLCFFLWNKGAVITNTATLAVFNNFKSPLAVVVSLLFFHESTNILRLIIGLSIISVALFLAEKQAARQRALTIS